MHVLVDATPEQIRQIQAITGNDPIPAVMTETGSIVNMNLGPSVLEQLADYLGVHWSKLPTWDNLDRQTQEELAMLTADSAPWAMDQELHDSAAEGLSERTRAILLGTEHPT